MLDTMRWKFKWDDKDRQYYLLWIKTLIKGIDSYKMMYFRGKKIAMDTPEMEALIEKYGNGIDA